MKNYKDAARFTAFGKNLKGRSSLQTSKLYESSRELNSTGMIIFGNLIVTIYTFTDESHANLNLFQCHADRKVENRWSWVTGKGF